MSNGRRIPGIHEWARSGAMEWALPMVVAGLAAAADMLQAPYMPLNSWVVDCTVMAHH